MMYVLVFVTRYLALFSPPYLYLIVMKVFFISSSMYIIYLMKFKYRPRVEVDIDSIRVDYILGACAVLALLFNYKFTPLEIAWSFSVFLESVAILPQMFLLQRLGEAETLTTHYIFALGIYRVLYIVNWVWRYVRRPDHSLITEPKHHFDYITFLAGIVQAGLYADFFYSRCCVLTQSTTTRCSTARNSSCLRSTLCTFT